MGGVNNALDKFGRQKFSEKGRAVRGPPGIGFKLNDQGQYDLEGKSLTNVASPINPKDAANQEYVDKIMREFSAKINVIRGPAGIGFKLTDQGQYDIEGKSITNVASPINPNDAANHAYVHKIQHETRKQFIEIINKDVMQYIRNLQKEFDSRITKLEAVGNPPITTAKKRKN